MTIELTEKKKNNIKEIVSKILKEGKCKCDNLLSLIGKLVAACPGVKSGWLYYKNLERLKVSLGPLEYCNRSKIIYLTKDVINDLKWWENTIKTSNNNIQSFNFDMEIFSDASTTGWGATFNGKKARGLWNDNETSCHINYLEFWEWCIRCNIWIFAEYVASNANPADKESRIYNIDTEWELSQDAYRTIVCKFGQPDIDLFASRINKKCKVYYSWQRDPEAVTINTFTINLKEWYWYAFPPFSMISKVLKKIREERSTGILVVPNWNSQPWYPVFKKMLISELFYLYPSNSLLLSPCRNVIHPLSEKLCLSELYQRSVQRERIER